MRKSEQTLFCDFLHTDKGQTVDKKKSYHYYYIRTMTSTYEGHTRTHLK